MFELQPVRTLFIPWCRLLTLNLSQHLVQLVTCRDIAYSNLQPIRTLYVPYSLLWAKFEENFGLCLCLTKLDSSCLFFSM